MIRSSSVLLLLVIFNLISTAQTVTIGKQVWMTKNLDVSTFRNGEIIPQIKSEQEWKKASENEQPAWCFYNFDAENGKKYGKLYNWYAVNDPRGLAPTGWHVPSATEWDVLQDYSKGKYLQSIREWSEIISNATDKELGIGVYTVRTREEYKMRSDQESGFLALPGGCIGPYNEFDKNKFLFAGRGFQSFFWTASNLSKIQTNSIFLNWKDYWTRWWSLESKKTTISFKGEGHSVRCVKD